MGPIEGDRSDSEFIRLLFFELILFNASLFPLVASAISSYLKVAWAGSLCASRSLPSCSRSASTLSFIESAAFIAFESCLAALGRKSLDRRLKSLASHALLASFAKSLKISDLHKGMVSALLWREKDFKVQTRQFSCFSVRSRFPRCARFGMLRF